MDTQDATGRLQVDESHWNHWNYLSKEILPQFEQAMCQSVQAMVELEFHIFFGRLSLAEKSRRSGGCRLFEIR